MHSSLFDNGYPSHIAVVNTGGGDQAVTLGIYNADNGARVGGYTTPAIAPQGELMLSSKALETAGGMSGPAALHYVVKMESPFTGHLQHLVINSRAGVVTDMTASCNLDGVAAPATMASDKVLRASTVFSSTQGTSQSFLRFTNSGARAGTVQVTLSNATTGQALTTWTSPSIPPGSEQQYPITTLEAGLSPVGGKPDYYSVSVQSGIAGQFQHVLYRPADGTLTNLSTCGTGITADAQRLSAVHSSLFDNGFPSTVAVINTAAQSKPVTLGVYNADTGGKIGQFQTASVPANGQITLSAKAIETGLGLAAPPVLHYVVKIESSFAGYLQHLVLNQKVGVVTDMTTTCQIPVMATFANVTAAKFSAALPVTSVIAVKSDAPNKTSALAYLNATAYGFGNIFGNGRNDIVAAPTYNDQANAIPIEFWRNNGDGTFTNRTADIIDNAPTTELVGNVFVADLNSDGRDDVFMVDTGWERKPSPYYGAFNKLLLSGPDGKLHDASATLPQATKSYNHRSTMMDFNGDGCQDFIITELGGMTNIPTFGFYTLINDCKGNFSKLDGMPIGPAQRTRGVPTEGLMTSHTFGVYHTTAADLSGDDKPDIIISGTHTDEQLRGLRIYDGGTNYALVAKLYIPAAILATSSGATPVSIVPVDIDGDGKRDIILHLETSGSSVFQTVIFRNLGNYQFADVTLQYMPTYTISSLPGGNTNMRKMVLKEVTKGTNALIFECGQMTLAQAMSEGKCIFNLPTPANPTLAQIRPTFAGRDITDADLTALAPNPSWTCPVRGGTQLVFDADGDGVMDLVYVNGQCVSPPTADSPQMTNNLQVVVFPSGVR